MGGRGQSFGGGSGGSGGGGGGGGGGGAGRAAARAQKTYKALRRNVMNVVREARSIGGRDLARRVLQQNVSSIRVARSNVATTKREKRDAAVMIPLFRSNAGGRLRSVSTKAVGKGTIRAEKAAKRKKKRAEARANRKAQKASQKARERRRRQRDEDFIPF